MQMGVEYALIVNPFFYSFVFIRFLVGFEEFFFFSFQIKSLTWHLYDFFMFINSFFVVALSCFMKKRGTLAGDS